MNLEEIRTLAEIMNDNGLTAIEITEGESNIRLEKNPPAPACIPTAPMPIPAVVPAAPAQAAAPAAEAPAQEAAAPASGSFSNLTEVKAPMVGVFYDSPSPEADPYVKVGDKVKKGDVLCIIEAMKLLNEITAEQDGEIVDICAHNADVVEYGQTLFKIF